MKRKRYARTEAEGLLAEVVRFAEAGDDASVSEGRALLSRLMFAQFGDVMVGRNARRHLLTWTPEQIRARQRSLSHFLRMFLMPIAFDIQISSLQLGAARLGPDVALRIDGQAGDVLTFQTINLLRAAGVRRLQLCECRKVFARVGRQEFCSERCQKRVYMKAMREQERKERQHGKSSRKK